jgi:hypothetical protein
MDENLIRTLDLRYCHPATAKIIDREVDALLQYAEDATGRIEAAETERDEAKETLDRVREMVRDLALQMERKGSFNTKIEDDHAADLCDYADKIREAID